MSAQVETIASSLFERLEVFLHQDDVKPLALASLRRDAMALKKVDALQAYVAEGLIASLVYDKTGVQNAYQAARHLNMGFSGYYNFFIAFHRVFDFERVLEMMDSLIRTCNRSDATELKMTIDNAVFLMRVHDVAQLNQSARLLRSDYMGNVVVERMLELGLPETALHDLVRLAYELLAHHGIQIVQGGVKQEFAETEFAYFVLQYYVLGYENAKQLAQLQLQLDELIAEYEDKHGLDLSAVVLTLLPYSGEM